MVLPQTNGVSSASVSAARRPTWESRRPSWRGSALPACLLKQCFRHGTLCNLASGVQFTLADQLSFVSSFGHLLHDPAWITSPGDSQTELFVLRSLKEWLLQQPNQRPLWIPTYAAMCFSSLFLSVLNAPWACHAESHPVLLAIWTQPAFGLSTSAGPFTAHCGCHWATTNLTFSGLSGQ
jgi:hypothetical protein